MNPIGGIGQQVGADLMELGKSVVKGVGEAAESFVKPDEGKQLEQGKSDDGGQQAAIKKQKELFAGKIVIPPLILRGNDLFIFDGYARYHFFKDIGIKRCLAYVNHRK